MLRKWYLDWKRERWFKEMDFKPVTPRQRELLTQMLYSTLVEIRHLCWENKMEQAAALADAFHNLPSGIYADNFSFPRFKGELESYQSKYRPPDYGKGFDYTDMLEKVMRGEDLFPDAQ